MTLSVPNMDILTMIIFWYTEKEGWKGGGGKGEMEGGRDQRKKVSGFTTWRCVSGTCVAWKGVWIKTEGLKKSNRKTNSGDP